MISIKPPEGFFTQVQTFPTLVVSIRTQPAGRFVPIQNIQWRLTPRWSTSIVAHDQLAKNHIPIVHTRDASKHLPLGKHFSAIELDTTQFTYEGRTHQEVNLGNKWTGRWRWSTNYFLLVWSSKLSIKEPQENRKQKISTTFVVSFCISSENKVHLYAWIHLQDFWPIWDEISSYTARSACRLVMPYTFCMMLRCLVCWFSATVISAFQSPLFTRVVSSATPFELTFFKFGYWSWPFIILELLFYFRLLVDVLRFVGLCFWTFGQFFDLGTFDKRKLL